MSYQAGQFSKLAGINSETLRYYEKNKLLTPAGKTDAGYRLYSDESLKQIKFIKQAKALGFSLKEIKELLSLRPDVNRNCQKALQKTQTKLLEVQLKIKHLSQLEKELEILIDDCKTNKRSTSCPIITKMDS